MLHLIELVAGFTNSIYYALIVSSDFGILILWKN